MSSTFPHTATPSVLGVPPIRTWHRPLVYFSVLSAVLAAASFVGLFVDERTVLGEPVWSKPFKFAISFGLYTITLAWMFSLFPRWRRTLWVLGTALAAACLVETVIIFFQAGRGVRSHFNVSSAFDVRLQEMMGNAAVVLLLGTVVVAVMLLVQKKLDRPMAWAIRSGIILCVVGMAFGPFMTQPTTGQLDSGVPVEELDIRGGHSRGAEDGEGSAMPVTHWNAESGDLRIPHFVGLHGLQAIPLLALGLTALSRRAPALRSEGARTALVIVAGAGYAGLIAVLGHQAFRGQALLPPDALALGQAGGLLAAVALAAGGVYALAAHRARR